MFKKPLRSKHLYVACTKEQLEEWTKAAFELNISLSTFVRNWLDHASERDLRGRLIKR